MCWDQRQGWLIKYFTKKREKSSSSDWHASMLKMFLCLLSSVSLQLCQPINLIHRCSNWQCREKTNPSPFPAGARSTSTNPNALWLVNCSWEDTAIWFPSKHWSALQQGTDFELLRVCCAGDPDLWRNILCAVFFSLSTSVKIANSFYSKWIINLALLSSFQQGIDILHFITLNVFHSCGRMFKHLKNAELFRCRLRWTAITSMNYCELIQLRCKTIQHFTSHEHWNPCK